jgi:hypothetical protein
MTIIGMNKCSKNIFTILKYFIDTGWINLSKLYYKNKTAKTKKLKYDLTDNDLKLFDQVRIYVIQNKFDCVPKHKQTIYKSFGSTNITSDYDIQIIGYDAYKVLNKLFTDFYLKYKNTLQYAFDTNLYCDGLYLYDNNIRKKKYKEICKFDNNYFYLLPYTQYDKQHCIIMAFVKLLCIKNIKNINELNTNINKYLLLAQKYKDKYDNKLKKNIIPFNYNKKHEQTIKMIRCMVNCSKKIYDILYNKKNGDIIKEACKTLYYAIDAYKTPSTIAVIVYSLQADKKLKLSKEDYLCALIENIGDLNNHIKHEKKVSTINDKKILLVKYSKYIYRMYYCMVHISNDIIIKKKYNNIVKYVLPIRKLNNPDKLNLIHLGMVDTNIKKFINNETIYACSFIEQFLISSQFILE